MVARRALSGTIVSQATRLRLPTLLGDALFQCWSFRVSAPNAASGPSWPCLGVVGAHTVVTVAGSQHAAGGYLPTTGGRNVAGHGRPADTARSLLFDGAFLRHYRMLDTLLATALSSAREASENTPPTVARTSSILLSGPEGSGKATAVGLLAGRRGAIVLPFAPDDSGDVAVVRDVLAKARRLQPCVVLVRHTDAKYRRAMSAVRTTADSLPPAFSTQEHHLYCLLQALSNASFMSRSFPLPHRFVTPPLCRAAGAL